TRIASVTEISTVDGDQVRIVHGEGCVRVATVSVIADAGGHVGAHDRRAGQPGGSAAFRHRAVVWSSDGLGGSQAGAGCRWARIWNAIRKRSAEEQDVAAGIHCAAHHLRQGRINLWD